MPPEALSVGELTRRMKTLLEDRFEGVWIRGELRGLKRPGSGHLYFSLKDEDALIKAVMFRFAARGLRFDPGDGDEVLAFGTVTMYEPRGDVQLRVTRLVPSGKGALQRRFEALKAKLEAEGLFAADRKRPLPPLPRRLALVTSPTGAVVHDMLRVLTRRHPRLDILVVPTRVQGEGAAEEIAAALGRVAARGDRELVLLGRGGGSLEDLWALNEEAVARAIFACPVPVVSAVGHEVDVTISDLVADRRAPTPSAAAELAVPERARLVAALADLDRRRADGLRGGLSRARQRLGRAADAAFFRRPRALLEAKAQRLDDALARLGGGWRRQLSLLRERRASLAARLDAVGPRRVLARGFGLVQPAAGGPPLRDAGSVAVGDHVVATLARGRLTCEVVAVDPEAGPGAAAESPGGGGRTRATPPKTKKKRSRR